MLGWRKSWGNDFARILPVPGFWTFMRAKRDGEAIRLMDTWIPRVRGNVHCCAFWRTLGKKGGHEYLDTRYTPELTSTQLRDLGMKFKCAASGTVEAQIELRRLPPGAGGKVNKAAAKRKEDMDSDVSCDDDDDNEFSIGAKRKLAPKPAAKGGAKEASKFPSYPAIPTEPHEWVEKEAKAPKAPKVAKVKAEADDLDLHAIVDAPKKAAPKPKAAKEGGAAVAKAAPKKDAAKAMVMKGNPVAARDRPARFWLGNTTPSFCP